MRIQGKTMPFFRNHASKLKHELFKMPKYNVDVATQFLTHVFDIFSKKSKNREKQ